MLRATEVFEKLPTLISNIIGKVPHAYRKNLASQVALLTKREILDTATMVLRRFHVSIDVDLESGIGRRRKKKKMKALRSASPRTLVIRSRAPFV